VCALVLTEAFTPTTIANLYRMVEDRRESSDRPEQWRDQLNCSRSGDSGGWANLGIVHHPGDGGIGEDLADPSLPPRALARAAPGRRGRRRSHIADDRGRGEAGGLHDLKAADLAVGVEGSGRAA
jgi:hypothetical protein